MDRLRHRTTLRGGDTAHKNVIRCSYLESKTEMILAKAQGYIEGGDTAQKKSILGGGDTAHTLLMRGTIGVGTWHNIERKSKSLN